MTTAESLTAINRVSLKVLGTIESKICKYEQMIDDADSKDWSWQADHLALEKVSLELLRTEVNLAIQDVFLEALREVEAATSQHEPQPQFQLVERVELPNLTPLSEVEVLQD